MLATMPPIVSQVPEHASAIHQDLQRTLSVLRACQYNDRVSNSTCGSVGGMDPMDHHKIVGGHLLLGKRSSTPIGASHLHHHHPALSATASLITAAAVASSQQQGVGGQVDTPDLIDQTTAMDPTCLGGVHRRLDRSHSEPVWQQQQLQPQDGRQGTNSSRYKTELCRPFEENGFCKYGDKCQFAHGGVELRTLNRHPKYKTELCRTFHTIGICPYGPRCHFIHNAEESRVLSPVMAAGPMPPLPFSAHHLAGGSPPPALVPSTVGIQSPLTVAPSQGLPTIFDKSSPPSSLHGSPKSLGVFFDETAFSLFQGNILEGLAESLANSLHLNNKVNLHASLSNEINNHLNNNNNNLVANNNINANTKTQITNNGLELLMEGQQAALIASTLDALDTPPASPPDTSLPAADRLPIFQSMNPVQ